MTVTELKQLLVFLLLPIFFLTDAFFVPVSLSGSSEFSVSDTLVQMERTICYGTCPSYTLTILEDGKVTFNGREFVDHKGEATREMSHKNLKQLIQEIHDSQFMKMPSNPECESRYTDMPSVFLTIELDGERNSVTHYHGCKEFQFEEELYDLEEAIDSLANTQQWIGES